MSFKKRATLATLAVSFGCSSTPTMLTSSPDPEPPRSLSPALSLPVAGAEVLQTFGTSQLLAMARTGDSRVSATRALGRVGGPRAVQALIELLGDPDADVRRSAARALGMAGADSAELVLLKQIATEPEQQVKRALVLALGQIGSDASIASLTRLLDEPGLAESAAITLGRLGIRGVTFDAAAVDALGRAARSKALETRVAVAFALVRAHKPKRGPEVPVAVLRTLVTLANDADTDVRALAIRGLAIRDVGDSQAIRALDDADWRVRVQAARALGRPSANPESVDALAHTVRTVWSEGKQARWSGSSLHVVTEGLRSLTTRTSRPSVAQLADELARSSAALLDGSASNQTPLTHDIELAASTVHCMSVDLQVRRGADRAHLEACGGASERGLPVHERHAILARALADGAGGGFDERWAALSALMTHPASNTRAAAMTVVPTFAASSTDDLDSATHTRLIALLNRGIADPAISVAGASVSALVEWMKTDEHGVGRRLAQETGDALLARARAERNNHELMLALMDALAVTRARQGIDVCTRHHRHPNRTLRAGARVCITALSGTDPGPGRPAQAPAPPPYTLKRLENRQLHWHLQTTRGAIQIALDRDAAPWHVAAIVHLTERAFYNDLAWHRVVPNFVIQGGDPTGTGWGGPTFEIPAEPSTLPFRRGTVGIADAGLGTGGSQLFIMHGRAHHLDARYTRIGEVVRGQDVVDAIAVGDRIVSARVVDSNVSYRGTVRPAQPPQRRGD